MSATERNKGKLVPATLGDLQEEFPNLTLDTDDLSWKTSARFELISGKLFKVLWEVEGDTEFWDNFVDVDYNEDGTISFHTLHYNGGAHWTELLEGKV